MKLFPYSNLKLKTRLSIQEVQNRLSEIVQPRQRVCNLINDQHKPYEGEVNEEDFSISLITRYTPEYKIEIIDSFQHEFDECVVDVKIRFNQYYYLALFFLFMIFLLVIKVNLVQPLLASNTFSSISSFEFIIVLFVGAVVFITYISVLRVFLKYLNTVKKDFCALLKTEEVEDLGFRGERRKEYE